MRWVITGGCGFIGSSLSKVLLRDNRNYIRVIDDLSVGTKQDLSSAGTFIELTDENYSWNSRLTLIEGDVKNPKLAIDATKDADTIVHLAANTGVGPSVIEPRLDMENNVYGIFNYLEAARMNNIKRFVFASSGAPIGEVEPPIHENLAARPVSPYGASKLAGEGYCSAYAKTFGISTVALRFGNVYGPGSTHKDSVVAKFIKNALAGEDIEVYGDGAQTRDFIYIDDLVRAIVLASTSDGVSGEIFQIATNRETSISELVNALQDVFTEFKIPNPDLLFGKTRTGDVRRNYSNTAKAKSKLGWTANTELRDGISSTIKYFMDLK